MLLIDEHLCLSCVGCIPVCPEAALYHDLVRLQVIPEKCTDCNLCARFCPMTALTILSGDKG